MLFDGAGFMLKTMKRLVDNYYILVLKGKRYDTRN
jgi:hypothetical protein